MRWLHWWLLLRVTIFPDISMLSLTSEVVLTHIFPVWSLFLVYCLCFTNLAMEPMVFMHFFPLHTNYTVLGRSLVLKYSSCLMNVLSQIHNSMTCMSYEHHQDFQFYTVWLPPGPVYYIINVTMFP